MQRSKLSRWPNHIWKWFKWRFIDKRHIINTGLEPGYHDPDEVLIHGMGAVLRTYVEKEHGGLEEFKRHIEALASEAHLDQYGNVEGQIATEREILAIYRWWVFDRPSNQNLHDDLVEGLYGKHRDPEMTRGQLKRLETQMAETEEDMLIRLVKIRRSLWT